MLNAKTVSGDDANEDEPEEESAKEVSQSPWISGLKKMFR